MSKYNTAKTIKRVIYTMLLIFLIGYGIFNSRIFIAGPQIKIESPKNGSTITESPLVDIIGVAKNIAFIELNGRQINVDESSNLKESVLLYPGYNIIKINARDKFNREIEREIELIYGNDDLLNDSQKIKPSLEKATSSLEISTSTPTTSLEEI